MAQRAFEPEQGNPEAGVEIERSASLGNGFVVATSPIERARQVRVDDERKRLDLTGALMLLDGLVVPAQKRKISTVPVPAERIVGIESQSATEFLFCVRPVPVVPRVGGSQSVVGAGEIVV